MQNLSTKIFRVGITGPESSGKTTLAKQLANNLSAEYIPEFARIYLEQHGPSYTFDDVVFIAQNQIDLILATNAPLVICDTESIVLNIWMDVKYQKTPNFIIDSIKNNLCDIYILCSPDIPWEEDELRENPNNRHELFDLYIDYLKKYNLKYIVVSGNQFQRLTNSIEFIQKFCSL